jgi:hypothetical protein
MIVSAKGLVQVEFEGRGDKECEKTQKHHRERLEAHEKKGGKGSAQTLLHTQVRWPLLGPAQCVHIYGLCDSLF